MTGFILQLVTLHLAPATLGLKLHWVTKKRHLSVVTSFFVKFQCALTV